MSSHSTYTPKSCSFKYILSRLRHPSIVLLNLLFRRRTRSVLQIQSAKPKSLSSGNLSLHYLHKCLPLFDTSNHFSILITVSHALSHFHPPQFLSPPFIPPPTTDLSTHTHIIKHSFLFSYMACLRLFSLPSLSPPILLAIIPNASVLPSYLLHGSLWTLCSACQQPRSILSSNCTKHINFPPDPILSSVL